jgi:hypothetical protein
MWWRLNHDIHFARFLIPVLMTMQLSCPSPCVSYALLLDRKQQMRYGGRDPVPGDIPVWVAAPCGWGSSRPMSVQKQSLVLTFNI